MAGFNPVDILNKALFELKQDLRPDDVLDYLLSEGVLTQSEFDRCREHPGRQSQCGELIDILRHKGENGYKHFCIILERTQGHLKTLLDELARKEGTPKYVYMSETDMEAALHDRDSVITEKNKIIAGKEEELQIKNSEIQSLETSHKEDIKQLKENHVNAMNKMKEEHAVSIEQEKNKLQTELIQEQERKQAVDQRLEEERKQTLDCKKEILQLTDKLVKLEEKYESCTTVQTLKPPKTTESIETTAVRVEPGQCVLKTSAECNNKQLLLLPCLHDVCQPCVDQHSHKTIICKCGQQVDLEKERLPPDFVSRNKAMLSSKEFQCGYLTEPCKKEVASHCTACNVPLCQDCQDIHAKLRSNATHEVIAVEHIEENPPWKHPGHTTCTDHPGQQLVYLDKHCKKSICNICFTGKHEDHEVRALEKEYEERKNQQSKDLQKQEAHLEEFRQCLKSRQNRLDKLQQKHHQLEKDVSLIHERNVVKYLHHVKALLQKIRNESKKIQGKILEDIKYLSDKLATLESTTEYAKTSLEFTSQAELLELADVIAKRISEDLSLCPPEDSTRDIHIVFCNHGQRALEQLFDMFGDVECTDTPDVDNDNIMPLLEKQERCQATDTEVQRLQTSIADIKHMVTSLEMPLQQLDFQSYIELDTPNHHDYVNLEELGVEVNPEHSSFRFKVRAQNDAYVALLKSAGDTSQNMYEIVIGGWSNTRSVIRNVQQGDNLADVDHCPLDCSKYRDFWISWRDGVISVGTGILVGKGQFMKWTDPDPNEVNYIGVSTGFGSSGWWRFEKNIRDPTVGIGTGNDYVYRSVPELPVRIKYLKSFTFHVKASNDAHIALIKKKGDADNDMYEIVIGGWSNTQSVIREEKQGVILAHVLHNPLSSEQHIPFWISFYDGTISVGHGTVVGRRMFMSWTDPTPTPVKYVSVATGWGATGHWLFHPQSRFGPIKSSLSDKPNKEKLTVSNPISVKDIFDKVPVAYD